MAAPLHRRDDGGERAVAAPRGRPARLHDDTGPMRDVCLALGSQRAAGNRPLVARAEPPGVPRADRMAAPGAARWPLQGKSAWIVALAGRGIAACDAASVEDARACLPRRTRRRAPAHWRWNRTIVLERIARVPYHTADRTGGGAPRRPPRPARPRRRRLASGSRPQPDHRALGLAARADARGRP